ncbi:GNAT family N-acetyltransferase [Parahaliea mediterranea]|uniref:GNAT family N-acetyltransferase n=1 Tax=Parahaliea mediterranea TaxID=651086 RepID=UPI0013009B5D|nr:GNAT family protein [Parahaliea mediterranea]
MAWLRRLARQLLSFRSHHLYGIDCRSLAPPSPPDGELITLVDRDSAAAYPDLLSALVNINTQNRDYLREIHRGRMACALITVDGKLAHYGFLYLKNRSALLLGLPVKTALAGNAFTVPAFRGRGCQGRSLLKRACYANKLGFDQVVAETSVDNIASGKGLRKAGMVFLGRMDYLVLLRVLVIRWRRPPGFPLFSICLG